jgi:hypothetical protein
VKGVLFRAGANPARQLSLQPEALEAVQGVNELDLKHFKPIFDSRKNEMPSL